MSNVHGLKTLASLNKFCDCTQAQDQKAGNFGRLFPELPPSYQDPDILRALGAINGPMDGGESPERTSTVPVGQVFFGQFIDHDITLDVTSAFNKVNDAEEIPNARTPTLDLDCIYGSGPEASPFLYEQSGDFAGVKLLTGAEGTASPEQPAELAAEDLTRSPRGTAVIGDPRNDENRIISQMQLGIIRFHNQVADTLSSTHTGHDLYVATRDLVTRHYHWAVVNDFLVNMCGRPVVDDILANGRKFYCIDDTPFIPVEFSVAAYRFGHTMAPQTIRVQAGGGQQELFGPVLGRGFTPLASADAVVQWTEVLETTASPISDVQKAEKMDGHLARILLELPFIPENDERSLATRNLLRGQSFLLPSGENVAARMGRPATEVESVSNKADQLAGGSLKGNTPLWYYILTEGRKIGRETTEGHYERGEGLGPVGARIVAEVLIGLMEKDSNSYLASDRSWSPKDGLGENVVSVGDLLTYTAS